MAKDEQTIDNDFVDGDLDINNFDGSNVHATVPSGSGGGPGAAAAGGTAAVIDNLRTQLGEMRSKIGRALRIEVRANTTEQICRLTANEGGNIIPDPGVRVLLPGSRPGEGTTILPTPGPSVPGPQNDGSSGSDGRLEDGQVIYFSKGISRFEHHGLDTIIRMAPALDLQSSRDQGGPRKGERTQLASGFPVMMVPNLRDAKTCKTFGLQPQVVISPPIGLNVNFRVDVSGIIVAVVFTLKITPVSASFSRTGLCWQGVCDGREEVLEGTVFCSLSTQFSITASGRINFGPISIGGAAGHFSTGVELSKPLDFRLQV